MYSSYRKFLILGSGVLLFTLILVVIRKHYAAELTTRTKTRDNVQLSVSDWIRTYEGSEYSHSSETRINMVKSIPDWLAKKAKRVKNPYNKCQDLYPLLNVTDPYPEDYISQIKAHNETYWKQPSVYEYYQKKGREPDGYGSMCCPAQVQLTMDLARIPWVKTICEVGFNAGHSALSWLHADPSIFLYSFDLGYHEYTRPMADYLKDRFPGRFEIILGDSTKTLPTFINDNPDVTCDVMSIDGAHFYQNILQDFNNFRKIASPINLLHYDDYPDGNRPIKLQDTGRAWEEKRVNGELIEIFKCNFGPDELTKKGMKGISLGHIRIEGSKS